MATRSLVPTLHAETVLPALSTTSILVGENKALMDKPLADVPWIKRPSSKTLTACVLDQSSVHMWFAFLPQHDDELHHHQMGLLAPEERCQHARFHFEKDRHRYLITRSLIRTVLSRYVPIDPKDWVFETTPYGRPRIANHGPLSSRICFNISHTDGLVAVALRLDRALGVDTEDAAQEAPLDIADQYLSRSELNALHDLPDKDRSHRFWELWTFKESYIKARGMGLSLPLDKFSINVRNHAVVSMAVEENLGDSADRWQLWQFRPGGNHLVAACLEQTILDKVNFSFWSGSPLGQFSPLNVQVSRRPLVCALQAGDSLA